MAHFLLQTRIDFEQSVFCLKISWEKVAEHESRASGGSRASPAVHPTALPVTRDLWNKNKQTKITWFCLPEVNDHPFQLVHQDLLLENFDCAVPEISILPHRSFFSSFFAPHPPRKLISLCHSHLIPVLLLNFWFLRPPSPQEFLMTFHGVGMDFFRNYTSLFELGRRQSRGLYFQIIQRIIVFKDLGWVNFSNIRLVTIKWFHFHTLADCEVCYSKVWDGSILY